MRKRKIISMLLSVLMICSIALFGCNGSTAHEHNMLKHEAQEATCEQEGNIEYWECEDCGKLFLDENGETETALEDVIVPKKAHEFSLKVTVANKRYVENTLLSKSDLTFKFECDNCSTTQNVSSQDVTVDLSKPLVKGVNNFTATYSKDNVNLSCTFSVTAVQKELSDIQVTYTGKTEYLVNEDFDIDSLTVKAIYDNGTQEDVTELAQVEYDKSKAGEQEVTITYGGISKTITVTVTDIIQSLNVAVKEGRILVDGQKITADDLVVTAIGISNEEYEITDFTIVNDDLSYPQTTVKVEYQGVEGSVVVDVYNNFKFPAGTNAKFGAGINGMPKVEDNGFVGNLSQNSGASLKFRIVSEESA
ncbi:MAG TPA: bacterial Ig-like domain-containing protein, partial [Clostridia bacterium]